MGAARAFFRGEEIQKSKSGGGKDFEEFELYLPVEIVKLFPKGQQLSEVVIAKAIRNLNFRIRFTGCSAKELWMKRDQFSGQPLTFTA